MKQYATQISIAFSSLASVTVQAITLCYKYKEFTKITELLHDTHDISVIIHEQTKSEREYHIQYANNQMFQSGEQ